MMDISSRPYIIITIGISGMVLGYFINYCTKKELVLCGGRKSFENYSYNEKIILIFAIICIIFYGMQLLRVIDYLRNGISYYYIRRMYQGYEDISFFKTSLELYISSYIAVPSTFILLTYIIISLFKKKYNRNVFTFAIIGEILYLIVSASRFMLMQVIIGVIYMFILQKKKLPKKIKKIIKVIIVGLIAGIIIVTQLRENRVNGKTYDWGMWKGAYSYFSVSIPLLDYWIEYIDSINFTSYGLAFFRAPLNIFNLLILGPLNIEFNSLKSTIEMINVVESFVQVFPKHTYNAFASMFYYLYLDFREIGVFLGSAVFGWLCGRAYKNAMRLQSDRNLAFLLIFIQAIFKSMVRWEFSSPSFFVAFIMTFFIFRKDKSDDKSVVVI
ncbi:Uncharacterised protein [uncultured Clostridium sp.]|nr:Uncharacterised protein [uncultured Clostridium sp.]